MSKVTTEYRVLVDVKFDADRSVLLRPEPHYRIAAVYYRDGKVEGYEYVNTGLERKRLANLHADYLAIQAAFTKPPLWLTEDEEPVESQEYKGLLSGFDRILGCLLGCGLGDAIGAPVEKKTASEIDHYIEHHVKTKDFEGVFRDHGQYQFGQITDDTQCSLLVAQSFDDLGTFSPEIFAQKITAFHRDMGLVGYGSSTETAISKLASGERWFTSGNPSPHCGNGAAMRSAILGAASVKYRDYPNWYNFILTVRDSCYPTHRSEPSVFGAQIVAGMARLLTEHVEPDLNPPAILAKLLIALKPYYGHTEDFQSYLNLIKVLRIPDKDRRTAEAANLALSLQPEDKDWPGLSPYVRPSVLWAVYSFFEHPTDFISAVSLSMSLGGDVDTTAAITGSLIGCFNGVALLPPRLLDSLEDRGEEVFLKSFEIGEELFSKVYA